MRRWYCAHRDRGAGHGRSVAFVRARGGFCAARADNEVGNRPRFATVIINGPKVREPLNRPTTTAVVATDGSGSLATPAPLLLARWLIPSRSAFYRPYCVVPGRPTVKRPRPAPASHIYPSTISRRGRRQSPRSIFTRIRSELFVRYSTSERGTLGHLAEELRLLLMFGCVLYKTYYSILKLNRTRLSVYFLSN